MNGVLECQGRRAEQKSWKFIAILFLKENTVRIQRSIWAPHVYLFNIFLFPFPHFSLRLVLFKNINLGLTHSTIIVIVDVVETDVSGLPLKATKSFYFELK